MLDWLHLGNWRCLWGHDWGEWTLEQRSIRVAFEYRCCQRCPQVQVREVV